MLNFGLLYLDLGTLNFYGTDRKIVKVSDKSLKYENHWIGAFEGAEFNEIH